MSLTQRMHMVKDTHTCYVYVHMCAHALMRAYIKRSDGNVQKLISVFPRLYPEDETPAIRLGSMHIYLLSYMLAPRKLF